MTKFRNDRISELMRHEIDSIIRTDVDDPRIAGTYSVTRVDVARDLRHAKVYISVLEPEHAKPMLQALKGAAGFIRRTLGERITIRYTPELQFVDDPNIAYGIHIANVLKDVAAADAKADEPPYED